MTRYAGYTSPATLVKDPLLSRDDKVNALRSWRGLVVRMGLLDPDAGGECERVIREISRALERLAAR